MPWGIQGLFQDWPSLSRRRQGRGLGGADGLSLLKARDQSSTQPKNRGGPDAQDQSSFQHKKPRRGRRAKRPRTSRPPNQRTEAGQTPRTSRPSNTRSLREGGGPVAQDQSSTQPKNRGGPDAQDQSSFQPQEASGREAGQTPRTSQDQSSTQRKNRKASRLWESYGPHGALLPLHRTTRSQSLVWVRSHAVVGFWGVGSAVVVDQ